MKRILITGSNGYIGKLFIEKSHELIGKEIAAIVALDIVEPKSPLENITYVNEDIRSENIESIIRDHKIDTVIHLAAIISISGTYNRDYEYDVDVNGSINLIAACIKNKVTRFITTSSGAAYGYWPSNVSNILTEDMITKGNYEIPYSYHKYLVEEHLKEISEKHPELKQYIFRVGTILGKTTKNPITDYLSKEKILCFKGYPSPFVAIWDQDLVNILMKAVSDGSPGTYNVAGDRALPTRELAKLLGKETKEYSARLVKFAFTILRPLRLVPYGPESIKFIQYRPVLNNDKLKEQFSYTPIKNTLEVFQYWKENNEHYNQESAKS